jgi:hypothetical protein
MSLLLPIALSAVFVFIASSIIHMVIGWHRSDFKAVPQEDAVMAALRGFNLAPGNYGFPRPTSMSDMNTPEFQAKIKAGPAGFLTIRDGNFSMGGSLAQWFVYSLVVSLFAGYIAGVSFGPGTEYLRIFQVAGCVAFVGYSIGQIHESIWWGRNWAWTFRNVIDGLIYGLLTGGTFGWLWPK